VVPTVTFPLLSVFVVLSLERRRLLHVHVTLSRDRDGIYEAKVRRRVAGLGLREIPIAPRSPCQNAYARSASSGRSVANAWITSSF
jgi:hypothetical protein